MKKQFSLLLITLFTFSALIAQDEDYESAPLNVEKALKKKFPKAESINWEMNDDGNWEAKFKLNGKMQSSDFSEAGEWLESERPLAQNEIPQSVLASLNKKYQKYKITESELVETKEGKWYEIEIETGGKSFEVMLDSKGMIVDEEEEEMEDDFEEEIEDDFEDED